MDEAKKEGFILLVEYLRTASNLNSSAATLINISIYAMLSLLRCLKRKNCTGRFDECELSEFPSATFCRFTAEL